MRCLWAVAVGRCCRLLWNAELSLSVFSLTQLSSLYWKCFVDAVSSAVIGQSQQWGHWSEFNLHRGHNWTNKQKNQSKMDKCKSLHLHYGGQSHYFSFFSTFFCSVSFFLSFLSSKCEFCKDMRSNLNRWYMYKFSGFFFYVYFLLTESKAGVKNPRLYKHTCPVKLIQITELPEF